MIRVTSSDSSHKSNMEQLHQQIVEQHLLATAQKVEDQLDNEMHQLQKLDEDDMESLRQQRLQQMKKAALKKKEWLRKGHGEYNEIASEKEFFAEMKGEERMICHFYRENWPCKVQTDMYAGHSSSGQTVIVPCLCRSWISTYRY